MVGYIFGTLRTDDSEEARAHNEHWLGENTLGIEVTRATSAQRCGFGNVDPQHGADSRSSAIEVALEWPLPPDGARLVTIRWDKDALGAMAVFMLRNAGQENRIDKFLVHWIGALDRTTYQNACEQYPQLDDMFSKETTDAMNVIVRHKEWPTLSQKVLQIAQILVGDMSTEEIRTIAALREYTSTEYRVEMFGQNVGFVCSPGNYEHARNWSNFRYPVFVVHDPERYTESGGIQDRWTLVRRQDSFDRLQFEADINVAEAAARGLSVDDLLQRSLVWGGSRNIVSSPQGGGYGTALTKEQILTLAQKHAESGIVS